MLGYGVGLFLHACFVYFVFLRNCLKRLVVFQAHEESEELAGNCLAEVNCPSAFPYLPPHLILSSCNISSKYLTQPSLLPTLLDESAMVGQIQQDPSVAYCATKG